MNNFEKIKAMDIDEMAEWLNTIADDMCIPCTTKKNEAMVRIGGMGMNYIVKNCPCYVEGIAIKGNEQKTQTCNNYKVRELTFCQDIEDCVIKQVIEKCKEHPFKDCACGDDILQLFDIEEINK